MSENIKYPLRHDTSQDQIGDVVDANGDAFAMTQMVYGLRNIDGINERNARARRIAACVNACEGLSTDVLENVTLLGDTLLSRFNHQSKTFSKVEQQRDELLAIIKKWQGGAEGMGWVSDLDREVIAKAEGK